MKAMKAPLMALPALPGFILHTPDNARIKNPRTLINFHPIFALLLTTLLMLVLLFISPLAAASSSKVLPKALLQTEPVSTIKGLSNADLCYRYATLSTFGQDYDRQALSYCNRAIRFDGLSNNQKAKAYVNRGVLLKNMLHLRYAQGDFRRAQRYLKRASAELKVNIGNIAYLRGDFTQALAHFNEAIDLGIKQRHKAYMNRGLAYERLGNRQAAKIDYQRALDSNPAMDNARQKLTDVEEETFTDKPSPTKVIASL